MENMQTDVRVLRVDALTVLTSGPGCVKVG